MYRTIFSLSLIFGYITGTLLGPLFSVSAWVDAQTIAELEARTKARNADIAALEKEIAQYQTQLNQTAQEAKTLKDLIAQLDATRKKLDADIALTQNRISATNLTITQLGQQIEQHEEDITFNRENIALALKKIARQDETSLAAAFLGANDVLNVWHDIKQLEDFQDELKNRIETLEDLKADLAAKQSQNKAQKANLTEYQNNLTDQKKVVEYNKEEKNKVLTQTQNKEAEYQKQLAQKKALRDAFQKELDDYESQLRIAVDPTSYPSARSGVLIWPLDKVIITQYFGNTAFATANAAVYGGKGHNGIDLGTPTGTKLKAALSGTVVGTGDTDLVCPNASYGKWVMIRHANGLSTLYAHLSVISVKEGQSVTTGQTIGYTGNTGYSTGPHLHFTVYATQGVQLVNRPSAACGGKNYYMPVADYQAYLNPLSYLPAL